MEDLVSIQEAINIKLTDLMHLIQMQSFGVGWIKSDGAGDSLKVDPGSMVQLPKDKDSALRFESQKANIAGVLDAISKLAKWACVSNGLSAGAMSVNVTEMSGIAKAWDSKELSSARFDDLETFRAVEHKLFDLIRIVNNVHNKKKLSDKAKIQIDFYDPALKAMSRQEQATSDGLQIEMGTLSPVDVLLRENPDIQSREDALSQLITIYYAAAKRLLAVIVEMDAVHKMTDDERKRAGVAKSKRYLEKNREKVNVRRRVHPGSKHRLPRWRWWNSRHCRQLTWHTGNED